MKPRADVAAMHVAVAAAAAAPRDVAPTEEAAAPPAPVNALTALLGDYESD
jgi:hypothetical protein